MYGYASINDGGLDLPIRIRHGSIPAGNSPLPRALAFLDVDLLDGCNVYVCLAGCAQRSFGSLIQ